MRNYKAMGDEKLQRVAVEGVPDDHQAALEKVLAERGFTVPAAKAKEPSQSKYREHIKPMLAKPSKKVPTAARNIIEPKIDGHRCLAYIEREATILRSRPGANIGENIPYIKECIEGLPAGTVLDGELSDMATFDRGRVQKITKRSALHIPTDDDPAVHYIIFDILFYANVDMKTRTLEARKLFLKDLFAKGDLGPGQLCYPNHYEQATEAALQRFLDEGYEGAVVKSLDGSYAPGSRSGWTKCKPDQEIDVLCTGTFPSEPGSKYDGNAVGGITYDYKRDDGSIYHGRAAGKMDDALRQALFVRPNDFIGQVVELGHWGITKDGVPLHPSFRRFRDDKVKEEL